MSPKTRGTLIDYAIAIDLVIMATGLSLLLDRPASTWSILLYQVVVAIAAWKGGWRGGVAATLASIAVAALTGAASGVAQGAILVAGCVILCAVVPRRGARKALRGPAIEVIADQSETTPIDPVPTDAIVEPSASAELPAIAMGAMAADATIPITTDEATPIFVYEEPKESPADKGEVCCFHCRCAYDATRAVSCRCLVKERTLVCPHCSRCSCTAPDSYREDLARPLVMLVEDDEDIPIIVQEVCSRLRFGFILARNGLEGLHLARRFKPDLILSDALMPQLDGREMCRLLRNDSETRHCKIVIMTGVFTDARYRTEALARFQADEYLVKPVAIDDLVSVLKKHLDQGDTTLSEEPPSEAQSDRDHALSCFRCLTPFDPVSAAWCSCLGREQTLICPACHHCFCKAPADFKKNFWAAAPPSVCSRKFSAARRNAEPDFNPPSSDVVHPLVMVVDDDDHIRTIVKSVATTLGYGCILAADGEQGLALASEYKPELVLSDAFMPKLDGREMCRRLKAKPSSADATVVIMSGVYTNSKYRREALTHFQVDDYVTKPIGLRDLIALIKRHLAKESDVLIAPSEPILDGNHGISVAAVSGRSERS